MTRAADILSRLRNMIGQHRRQFNIARENPGTDCAERNRDQAGDELADIKFKGTTLSIICNDHEIATKLAIKLAEMEAIADSEIAQIGSVITIKWPNNSALLRCLKETHALTAQKTADNLLALIAVSAGLASSAAANDDNIGLSVAAAAPSPR